MKSFLGFPSQIFFTIKQVRLASWTWPLWPQAIVSYDQDPLHYLAKLNLSTA